MAKQEKQVGLSFCSCVLLQIPWSTLTHTPSHSSQFSFLLNQSLLPHDRHLYPFISAFITAWPMRSVWSATSPVQTQQIHLNYDNNYFTKGQRAVDFQPPKQLRPSNIHSNLSKYIVDFNTTSHLHHTAPLNLQITLQHGRSAVKKTHRKSKEHLMGIKHQHISSAVGVISLIMYVVRFQQDKF